MLLKIFMIRDETACFKTLGTSVIYRPMSPSSPIISYHQHAKLFVKLLNYIYLNRVSKGIIQWPIY